VRINDERCVLRDVASRLLGTVLHDVTAETTKVDILLIVGKTLANLFHKRLYDDAYFLRLDARLLGYRLDYVCFSHNAYILLLNYRFVNFGVQRYSFPTGYKNIFASFFRNHPFFVTF
jgi:hypothetical protein